ncbi:MAG: polyhydroxyalkanoate synthesis regulator DNA-binding domain-containing protein [Proteobacteria bacterium]|nr:polyhydroxyalkanoate synthesis regulator DNA-binding domain-containing protein [Cystobacterineae bacterium]MCL2259568.1 polyhydroxyalkanoate synthesis regulator DNA-binding domain-containing protein [Cystobacterineae bacterium]MCL2313950.1 polyhydroxyalkanoate synthesis regulator DNA-binding domain-containing protein [Pseudomonadota bacterium]
MVSGKPPKIIKRYSNRKLYDTTHSCYVTLDDIARMVMEGHEVQILDNTTKKDLTAITLAHIVLEQERKKRRMPLHLLKAMVKKPGASIADFLRTEWSLGVQSLRESAERLLKTSDTPKHAPPEAQRRLDEKLLSLAEEFMANLYASSGDLAKLNARIENLETRLRALENPIPKTPPPPES